MNKKPLLTIILITLVVLFLPVCKSSPTPEYREVIDYSKITIEGRELSGSIQRVAAYIRTSWGGWDPEDIEGQYLTDLMLAFTTISDEDHTTLTGINDSWHDWERIYELKRLHPHLRINMSVGGWGAGNFSEMARDRQKRTTFIENCIEMIRKHNLDGIDVDWEYPVGPASWGVSTGRPEVRGVRNGTPPITVALEDRENYIHLLRELRIELEWLEKETGKYYFLSTCVPANDWFITRNDILAASRIVDSIKLMAYDYTGSWSQRTDFHANLHPASFGGWGTSTAVEAYLRAGVPPQKLMLGLATYGKEWHGVPEGNSSLLPGFNQLASGSRGIDVGYTQRIKQYLLPGSGFTRYWHPLANAAYLYHPTLNAGTFVCYLDEEQIQLIVAYSQEKGLGGIFYWEYFWDIEADLLRAMYYESTR